MKKTFTKLFSTALLTGLLMTGITAEAQTTYASVETLHTKDASKTDAMLTQQAPKPADPVDTSFHPVRRIWGYTFGDFYYDAHAPSLTATPANTQGKETNYYGVPANRNAFQFRRIYLGYDYDITKKFSVELLLASEPGANNTVSGTTSITNADNLADNKMSFYIKYINLRVKNLWTGTDLVIGQAATPGWSKFSEALWGYRSIEKTVGDFHKTNSYDMGAALQGVFDPATKNFGYDVMIGNNTQASLLPAANPNTGFFKAVYADIWGKFLDKKLNIQLYTDFMQTASTSTTSNLGGQSHNMIKGFVGYTDAKFTIGVEAYTNKFKNGLTVKTPASTPAVNQDATAQAISVFAHAPIVKELSIFARYDGYNPDNTDYNAADVYTVNTNFSSYDPYTKETFYTFGLDYTPTKNVHFMPNLWYIDMKDQRNKTVAGYQGNNHIAVARLTFFYTFGK